MRTVFAVITPCAIAMVLTAAAARGQVPTGGTARAQSVTIVVKDSFARKNLVAVVERGAGMDGSDLIAIQRQALSPELLAATLSSVARSRVQHGAVPGRLVRVNFLGGFASPPIAMQQRSYLRGVIARLTSLPRERKPRVGLVQSIEIPESSVARFFPATPPSE